MGEVGRKRQVWQLPAGSVSRSYEDVFLKYGVGLIGPGDAGPWAPGRDDEEFAGSFVRRFASEVKVGDVFLLHTALSNVCAIGIVASEYEYVLQFDDVDGWDLQHARRVRWYRLPQKHDFGRPVFPRSRFSRTWTNETVGYAERFLNSPPTRWQTAPLPPLPAEEPSLEEIPRSLQGVIAEVQDLRPLLSDRQRFGDHPTEDELVAHFVVPFLRSLGWRPEQIGLKWKNVDIALFAALPRRAENCHLIIEAKRLGVGVEGALKQAKGYLRTLGILRDVVVTDGVRYRMYAVEEDFASIAYANLVRLKQSALELFSRMRRP